MKINFKTSKEVDEIFDSLKTEQGQERLEKALRRLRTHNGVRRIHKLWEDANIHEGNALLLAVHYGTKGELQDMKRLILWVHKNQRISKERIDLASKLWKNHEACLKLELKKSAFAVRLNSSLLSNK